MIYTIGGIGKYPPDQLHLPEVLMIIDYRRINILLQNLERPQSTRRL